MGLALLPLSALLLGVAAGIGYPYITTIGWSVLAVAGAAALVLGVVTLAAGLSWLVRATSRWVAVLLVPLALLLVVVLAYVVAIPLMVDPRGHGDSSGRGMDWGWHGDNDIAAAFDVLASSSDVDGGRIAVVGLSVGGEEAVGAAAGDPRIAAVVAEGVTARPGEDLGWLSEEYGWRGAVTEGVKDVQTALVSLLAGAPPPVALTEAVSAATQPALLVVAGDVPDEQHTAERLRAAAPDTVEVWVVPGSGHTTGLRAEPRAWERTVVGFLDSTLQAP